MSEKQSDTTTGAGVVSLAVVVIVLRHVILSIQHQIGKGLLQASWLELQERHVKGLQFLATKIIQRRSKLIVKVRIIIIQS